MPCAGGTTHAARLASSQRAGTRRQQSGTRARARGGHLRVHAPHDVFLRDRRLGLARPVERILLRTFCRGGTAPGVSTTEPCAHASVRQRAPPPRARRRTWNSKPPSRSSSSDASEESGESMGPRAPRPRAAGRVGRRRRTAARSQLTVTRAGHSCCTRVLALRRGRSWSARVGQQGARAIGT